MTYLGKQHNDMVIDAQFRSKLLYMVARDARHNYSMDHDLDRYLNFAARAAIESAFARNMLDIELNHWYDSERVEIDNNWEIETAVINVKLLKSYQESKL